MSLSELKFRKNAYKYLITAKAQGILPGQRLKSIFFFPSGENSVVSKITTEQKPFVVKMRKDIGILEIEKTFLNEWSKQNVTTPKILTSHTSNKNLPVSILILEYINAPLLSDAMNPSEMLKKGITRKLGSILANMHKAKGEGFGIPRIENNTRGKFDTFSEYIETNLFKEKLPWLVKKGILTQKSIIFAQKAVTIIEADIESGTLPSLIHNDFGPYNIFYTRPLTVFDPIPEINHPSLCLASLLLRHLIDSSDKSTEKEIQKEKDEVLNGYRKITPISDLVIMSGSILKSLIILSRWQKKHKHQKIKLLSKKN